MSRFIIFLLLLSSSLIGAVVRTPTRFQPAGWWGGVDVLTVWRKKWDFPPLVTTSPAGTAQNQAGRLSTPSTEILFGNQRISASAVVGMQGEFGFLMAPRIGAYASAYTFGFQKIKDTWYGDGNGLPILARPFFNVVANAEQADFASYPTSIAGGVEVDTMNRIWGIDFGGVLRLLACRNLTCDFLGGFTYSQIIDSCDIYGTSNVGANNGYRSDEFSCRNNYYAGLVGGRADLCINGLHMNALAKFGIGSVVQTVRIEGNTYTSTADFNGGLLALPSNIGDHSRHRFQINSMLQGTVRYSLFGHLNIGVGYKFWYFPNVALAEEVVNRRINTSQIDGGALVGPVAPVVAYDDQSYWTQSLTTGFYFLY